MAGFLALVGFLTCGRISFGRGVLDISRDIFTKRFWILLALFPLFLLLKFVAAFGPRLVLDLSSLSFRGGTKITHDASFVHPDGVSSTSPRPNLLGGLLDFASTRRGLDGKPRDGLGLMDIAHFHVHRLKNAPASLNDMHSQIALGECALTWDVLRGHQCYDGPGEHDRSACMLKGRLDGVIPTSRLEQWFGQERLPDGWWDFEGVRPATPVGLVSATVLANSVGKLARKSSCDSCPSLHTPY
ncbi:hypothetical protein CPB84DRAFT_1795314 [Gymnopilus junonius]|uniref:Heme haloperoxidase family profile domain-containing protein n=1 Tax=Gymnopilus junonius TaxID=109634 RepID=A0A9P5N9S8_GYMJU|nr:hypothetical protein CPB84DRAFT_1795314 [Gymnopilus junonius]